MKWSWNLQNNLPTFTPSILPKFATQYQLKIYHTYILNHNFSAIIFYIVPIYLYIRDWPVLASIFSKVGCSAFSRVDFCARPVAHFWREWSCWWWWSFFLFMLWVPYPPPSIYTLRYRLFHISLKVSDQKNKF